MATQKAEQSPSTEDLRPDVFSLLPLLPIQLFHWWDPLLREKTLFVAPHTHSIYCIQINESTSN